MASRGQRRVLLVQPYNRFCVSQNMHSPTHVFRLAAHLRARSVCDAHVVDVAQRDGIALSSAAERHIAKAAAEAILAENWDVVGISLTACTQYPFVHRLLRELRRRREKGHHPLIVVGGYHALVAYPILLADDGADVVVFGDGESALSRLALGGKTTNGALARIPNIAYRLNRDTVRTPRVAARPEDKPTAATPAVLAHEAIYDTWVAFHRLGCAHHCAFCLERQMRGRRSQTMDPDISAAELGACASFFQVCNVYVGDPVIGSAGDQHTEYFREVRRRTKGHGLRLRIGAMMRADPPEAGLDDLLDAFQASGGDEIWIGLEHADDRILTRSLRKTAEPARYRRCFERTLTKLRERGIAVTVGLIIGSPGESRDSLERLWGFCATFLKEAQFYAGFYKPYRVEHEAPKGPSADTPRPWWRDESALTRVFASNLPAFVAPGLSEAELVGWKERLDRSQTASPPLDPEARSALNGCERYVSRDVLDFRAVLRALRPTLDRTEKWTSRAALLSNAVNRVCQPSACEGRETTGV